jgi:hypothetical protein
MFYPSYFHLLALDEGGLCKGEGKDYDYDYDCTRKRDTTNEPRHGLPTMPMSCTDKVVAAGGNGASCVRSARPN